MTLSLGVTFGKYNVRIVLYQFRGIDDVWVILLYLLYAPSRSLLRLSLVGTPDDNLYKKDFSVNSNQQFYSTTTNVFAPIASPSTSDPLHTLLSRLCLASSQSCGFCQIPYSLGIFYSN